MKVYPMGFTPDIKSKLISGAQRKSSQKKTAALEELDFLTHSLRTEEELAVIFAKVSRNPGSFEELARSVTEEGAANFHKKWTVSVEGYGHSSVAEHAMIHLAVENIASLDGDFVTDNRLASFTEFSARFKGRQALSYFTPASVKKSKILKKKWDEVHKLIFATNDLLLQRGMKYIETEEARKKFPDRPATIKVVSDQFKNLLPASRLTSIAITMNAREAENMIKKFLSSEYPSVIELGKKIKRQCLKVSPTLVRYAEPNDYLTSTQKALSLQAKARKYKGIYKEMNETRELVKLLEWDSLADEKIMAAALFSGTDGDNFKSLLSQVKKLAGKEKAKLMKVVLGKLDRWDIPVRALEFPGSYLVEFPGMTYGDWREYKRHRMQSYLAKELDVKWGYMVPPLAWEMDQSENEEFHGTVEIIHEVMKAVADLFKEVSKVDSLAARYCVTRLHYRPAIAKFNTRELFHLMKLRTSANAHPFIRRLMWPLFDQIKAVNPLVIKYLEMRLEKDKRPDRNSMWSY